MWLIWIHNDTAKNMNVLLSIAFISLRTLVGAVGIEFIVNIHIHKILSNSWNANEWKRNSICAVVLKNSAKFEFACFCIFHLRVHFASGFEILHRVWPWDIRFFIFGSQGLFWFYTSLLLGNRVLLLRAIGNSVNTYSYYVHTTFKKDFKFQLINLSLRKYLLSSF